MSNAMAIQADIDDTEKGKEMGESVKIKLTIADKTAVLITWLSITALLFFPVVANQYSIMFNDFGGKLPLLTKIVLKGWYPHGCALLSIVTMALRWFPERMVSIRAVRTVVILSLVLSCTGVALCVIGVNLPMFEMMDAISK